MSLIQQIYITNKEDVERSMKLLEAVVAHRKLRLTSHKVQFEFEDGILPTKEVTGMEYADLTKGTVLEITFKDFFAAKADYMITNVTVDPDTNTTRYRLKLKKENGI